VSERVDQNRPTLSGNQKHSFLPQESYLGVVKRTIALLSFLVALVLFGTALSSYLEEGQEAPPQRRDGVADLRRSDDAVGLLESQHHPDPPHFLANVALAGVVFLMAGCALWDKAGPSQKLLVSEGNDW